MPNNGLQIEDLGPADSGNQIEDLGPADDWQGSAHANVPLGQQILRRRAAAGQMAPKDELAVRANALPSLVKNTPAALTEAAGESLPMLGGGVGAMIGGPPGAALGGAGGEAYKQLLYRATGAGPAPDTSMGAAQDIAKEGAIQGAIDAVFGGASKLAGRVLGSGGPGAVKTAEDTIAAARRSGINPNNLTYAEASGAPMESEIQSYLDRRTMAGGALARRRAERLGGDVRQQIEATLGKVGPNVGPVEVGKDVIEAVPQGARASAKIKGAPYENLKARAAQAGTKADMSPVHAEAKTIQQELFDVARGIPNSKLPSDAEEILSNALTFQPLKSGQGTLGDLTLPEAQRFQTSLNDILKNPNGHSPDAYRIAARLKEPTRAAIDAAYATIPGQGGAATAEPEYEAAQAGWREHKKLFGKEARGMAGKIAREPDAQEAFDIPGKLGRSPSDTADMMDALDFAGAGQTKGALKARIMRNAVAQGGDLESQNLKDIGKRLRAADPVLQELADDPTSKDALARLADIAKVSGRATVLEPNYASPTSYHPHINAFAAPFANAAAIMSDMLGRIPIGARVSVMKGLATGQYGKNVANVARGLMLKSKIGDIADQTANAEPETPANQKRQPAPSGEKAVARASNHPDGPILYKGKPAVIRGGVIYAQP